MGSLEWEELDRRVGILQLAQAHNIVLTKRGDKLVMRQDPGITDPNRDVIFGMIKNKKSDVMAIMADAPAVRRWLDQAQQTLIALNQEVMDAMERWINVEKMYLVLHPNNQGCACAPATCRANAVVRCRSCGSQHAKDMNNGK